MPGGHRRARAGREDELLGNGKRGEEVDSRRALGLLCRGFEPPAVIEPDEADADPIGHQLVSTTA